MSPNSTARSLWISSLTRARHDTHIYAGDDPCDRADGVDRLQTLAERMGHTEPDLPSISIPLAQETAITARPDEIARQPESLARAQLAPSNEQPAPPPDRPERSPQPTEILTGRTRPDEHLTPPREPEPSTDQHGHTIRSETAIGDDNDSHDTTGSRLRRWPLRHDTPRSRDSPEVTLEQPERDRTPGWEP